MISVVSKLKLKNLKFLNFNRFKVFQVVRKKKQVKSTSEIGTSSDFRQSTIVWFEIVWISNNTRNPNKIFRFSDVRLIDWEQTKCSVFGRFY